MHGLEWPTLQHHISQIHSAKHSIQSTTFVIMTIFPSGPSFLPPQIPHVPGKNLCRYEQARRRQNSFLLCIKASKKTQCGCCRQVHLWAVCLQPFGSNVISRVQSLQTTHPAWTVGSCWQYVTSCGICHKGTCRLQQRHTSFDRMNSDLGWSGSDSGVIRRV